ncbi:MAG: hypothetical protein CVU38_17535, partial [Chloroflexi bacterium HGW-Chloroflexi-1]
MEMRSNGPQLAVFIDFENVATSAEADFGEFDVTAVMDLLRTRGRLLIKRAYGDWGRFHRYRRPMLENGIDLFQLYSIGIQQKNRADVRLAIDAVETVFTRPNIDLYAIISGDSDFTELVHKLRDHGKYTIGIGLRSATSDLLRRACDEFIFYETLVSEDLADISDELQLPDPRELLRRALSAAEQKGETPVFAGRLKQMMLGLDSSFNEANYGFQQFRAFLEAHQDLVSIEEQGLQLYVSLQKPALAAERTSPPSPVKPSADLSLRYRSFLREVNLRVVDYHTRKQALVDFIDTIRKQPELISLQTVADLLKDRYDAENALTQKVAVPDVMRLLVMSDALDFAGDQAASDAPVRHADTLTLEALLPACEGVYVWRLVEGGAPVFPDQLTPVLYDIDADPARVVGLCRDLIERRLIVSVGDSYAVAPEEISRLIQREELGLISANLAKVSLPQGEPVTPLTAENLFREGSDLRQKDFAGSAQRYLQAARIQLEALKAGQARAGFDDLKWYLASYCSVKAGHAFVTGNYTEATPYYLAFFGLAQEADSVWPRIQRLVNPMSSYFYAIAGKQLDETVPSNLGRSPACQVAFRIHNHHNSQVGDAWESLIVRLAAVNLRMIRQTSRDLTDALTSGAQGVGDTGAHI